MQHLLVALGVADGVYDGEAELALRQVLAVTLVLCVLLQPQVAVIISDLEVEAEDGRQLAEV